MFKRIDHVEIVPDNFEETISFYTQILGFGVRERRRIDNPPLEEIVFLELGDTVIEVFSVTNPAPASTEPWQVGCKRICLEVDSMEDTVEYLKSKGVKITLEPTKSGTAMRASFDDPSGLSVELRQPLA